MSKKGRNPRPPRSISERVRAIYQRRPYPHGNSRALKAAGWELCLEWVDTLGRTEANPAAPGRILVAGCGDGTEAFNVAAKYPKASVVAVDFSARSVAVAKRLQRRRKATGRIRFLQADLTAPGLAARAGRDFDLITCHGVLSYIPALRRAFRNLAQCLAPSGVLYLGVNGQGHLNTRMRAALPSLGLDPETFIPSAQAEETIRLCEEVLMGEGFPRFAHLGHPFLASDVFGPLNQCLTVEQWSRHARGAGLFLRGNWAAIPLFGKVVEKDLEHRLLPRSRAEVCRVFERLVPTRFHRLLYSRTPEAVPPWMNVRRLARWRPAVTSLYRLRLPRSPGKVRDRLVPVRITSAAYELQSRWRMAEWEAELLRRSDGSRTLGEIMRGLPLAVPAPELRKQLYLLQQLGIINLLPPRSSD